MSTYNDNMNSLTPRSNRSSNLTVSPPQIHFPSEMDVNSRRQRALSHPVGERSAQISGSSVGVGLEHRVSRHHHSGGYEYHNYRRSMSHQNPCSFSSLNAMDLTEREKRERDELEEKMSADELRVVLKKERALSTRLANDLMSLRDAAEASAVEAEASEECRILNLMRRLEGLQREKGRIAVELEREEEMLTNNLMKKMNELRREKQALEEQIERDHHINQQLIAQAQNSIDRNTSPHLPNAAGSGSGSFQS